MLVNIWLWSFVLVVASLKFLSMLVELILWIRIERMKGKCFDFVRTSTIYKAPWFYIIPTIGISYINTDKIKCFEL